MTSGRDVVVAVRRALFGVGLVATGRALVGRVTRQARAVPPPRSADLGPHPFDLAHGVATDGFRSWRELQGGGANDPYISGYLAIAPSVGRHLLARVAEPGLFTFVDLGCGMGRATILASERPFARVIGVEIVRDLADQAARNAAQIAERYPERTAIEIVHGDAALFALPLEPLVLFLYQPFERPVMRRVLTGLERSLAAVPRPALLIYANPVLARIVDRVPALERALAGALEPTDAERPYGYGGWGGTDGYVIWRTQNPRPHVVANV